MPDELDSNTIRIRMYRVGFGDCFLVSLPLTGDAGFRHILVDCGVHGKGNIGTMDEVVDNIGTITDKKLAVVIATHAHQDHISGCDLAKMDPPSGHSYLRLDGNRVESSNQLHPFASKWEIKPTDPEMQNLRLSEAEKKRIKDEVASDSLDGLAFALDKAINNTSVVTLFAFRGQILLFPGDAQYGNWEAWLQQSDSADILSSVMFLKVAHHGSVNATPKDALEQMSPGKFAAMVSTQSTPWPSIPRGPLMDRLKQQTKNKTIRSDSLAIKDIKAPKGPVVSKLPSGFVKGDFWYDYFIKL